jgi:hypothetical protein
MARPEMGIPKRVSAADNIVPQSPAGKYFHMSRVISSALSKIRGHSSGIFDNPLFVPLKSSSSPHERAISMMLNSALSDPNRQARTLGLPVGLSGSSLYLE